MDGGARVVSYASSYPVGSNPIRLTVTIGDGQFGSSLVQVGEKEFPLARTFSQEIGVGDELVGKRVQVFSVVTDTNLQTNRTSVTYKLEGGPQPLEHTLTFTVQNERETVDYKADFDLVAVKP